MSTQFGSVVGTLEYMSPEQAGFSGEDIETRADIYSLGVILYELLTGLRPIDAKRLRNAALTEMIRIIREEERSKPSTRLSTDEALPSLAALRQTDPRKLMSLLRGELDWVVMKCLEKHRERRYETANALARDIQRYLADEAVEARPASARYRFSKFVRRHKGQVIAASLVLLSLLGGLAAVAAVQTAANARLAASLARETRANRDLAAANAELTHSRAAVQARYELAVDAIKTFHTGVSEDFLLKEEKFKDLRNRLLKSASDFYGKLGALLGKESDLASRRALWQANYELAALTATVGKLEDALAADRQVLAAREALVDEFPAESEVKADVARSLTAVAGLLATTGKTNEAEATYRKAESLLVELAPPIAEAAAARAVLANVRSRLGGLLHTTGRDDEALSIYRLARAHQEALAAAPGATAKSRRDLAETINGIATLLATTGKPSAAEAEFRKALAIAQKLADDNPAVTDFRSCLAVSHLNVGVLLANTGKSSAAEAEYRTALAIEQKLADDNPAIPQFQRDLAGSLLNIGWRLAEAGKTGEAIGYYTREEAIRQKLAGASSATPEDRDYLANCQINAADVLRQSGRLDEALAACERAVAVREPLVEAHPEVRSYRVGLGETYLRLGQVRRDLKNLAAAADAWKRACAHYDGNKSLNPQHTFLLACCHAGLAGLAGRPGSGTSEAEGKDQAEKAMAVLRQAVALGYRNPNAYRTESALDPLREREDFKKLVEELEKPSPAKPEK